MQNDPVGAELVLDRMQEVLIPLYLQLWVEPALHEDLDAPEVDHLPDLVEDLLPRQYIALFVTWHPVECAEFAPDPTYVGVVYVAPDDIGDQVVCLGMELPAHIV